MLTDIQNKENCCGCQACVQICGRNCIQMQPDNEGFCYPVVDKEQCVSCGLCEQACPIICKEKQDKKTEPFAEAYIAINKNTIIREKSSSGGIFYLLAKEIIEQQGVVYGAAFTEEFEVEHTGVCNLDDLRKILGSKYVQSSTGNVFSEIKQHLKNGKTVLFSGTPCQVEGLHTYLGEEYDNLYCVDIICHGVPSLSVWKSYLSYLERKIKSKVSEISFRDKKYGWKYFSMKIIFQNGKVIRNVFLSDPFMRLFLKDYILRPSCYSCSFKGEVVHKSDITLGDFWGIEKTAPKWYDHRGVSAVLVHSSKGKKLFAEITEQMKVEKCEVGDVVKYNSALNYSSREPKERGVFWADYEKLPFDKVIEKWVPDNSIILVKRIVVKMIAALKVDKLITKIKG